ncbi:MAG: hypothetical protein ABFC88_14790 [Thermoguttaceae bacterium]
MSHHRTWRERCAVYIVTVHSDFIATSPWAWPDAFDTGTAYVKNISLMEARAIAMGFNKAAMEKRAADVQCWDRQWAVAGACIRNRWMDRFEDVPERPQLPMPTRRTSYTPEEIERLLTACDQARLPNLAEMSPGQWWRTLITTIVNTGVRWQKAIEAAGLPEWPQDDRKGLSATFHRLCRLAEIYGANGFHGLRRAYVARQEGGAA